MSLTQGGRNGGREQSWIDQLQVPDEVDYITRLQAMNLTPDHLTLWLAMEVYRTQRDSKIRSMGTAKLTGVIATGGTLAGGIAAGIYGVLKALNLA